MTIHAFPDNHTALMARLFLLLRFGVRSNRVKASHVETIIQLASVSHAGTVRLMIEELATRLDTSQHPAPSSPVK
jgi:hypothetical protein